MSWRYDTAEHDIIATKSGARFCVRCLRTTIESIGIDWEGYSKHARRSQRQYRRSTTEHILGQDKLGAWYCKECLKRTARAFGFDWGDFQEGRRRRKRPKKIWTPRGHAQTKSRTGAYFCRRCLGDAIRSYGLKWPRRRPHKPHRDEQGAQYCMRCLRTLIEARGINWNVYSKECDSARNQLRRSRIKNLPATFTMAQWRLMKEIYRNCCAYCGKKTLRLTRDHIVPVKHGGAYSWDNIVPACRSCNSKKGARPAPLVQPALPLGG